MIDEDRFVMLIAIWAFIGIYYLLLIQGVAIPWLMGIGFSLGIGLMELYDYLKVKSQKRGDARAFYEQIGEKR